MSKRCTAWLHKFVHKGDMEMKIFIIIPFLLYVSNSTIVAPNGTTRMASVHITPWLTFGFNWRGA